MRVNEKISISTNKVLLVPYEAHHVLKYHNWMQDPDIQEATASEPLSLEEEYENQQSWRTSQDKLTFIVCEPLTTVAAAGRSIQAKADDADNLMKGDINFFLYPYEDEEEDEVPPTQPTTTAKLIGEVDVMIANKQHRGHGYGEGAVRALLTYIEKHIDEILSEYQNSTEAGLVQHLQLISLMVKIKEANMGSRGLFRKLGFQQRGDVNYFGEVTMTMDWASHISAAKDPQWAITATQYEEIAYEYETE